MTQFTTYAQGCLHKFYSLAHKTWNYIILVKMQGLGQQRTLPVQVSLPTSHAWIRGSAAVNLAFPRVHFLELRSRKKSFFDRIHLGKSELSR